MAQAVGPFHLYPVVPIMNLLAMVSLPLLIPGFWKTRIVALVALVAWLFIANLLYFIGMIYWRGHTNDALVLASILSILWRAWNCGFWMSLACFAHFTWQRLQPLPIRQLYDTRRRNNWIHIFFTLILPLLWIPLSLVSSPSRYGIIEDYGALAYVREDWPGFVVLALPQILGCMTVGIFNVLALVSYWRMRWEGIDSDILKSHSSVRARKLLLMAVINIPLAMYGIYRQITCGLGFEWTTPTPLTENIASLQIVFVRARSDLDDTARRERTAIFMPLLAFYLFAWFGLGAEARKTYGEALLKLGRLVGVTLKEYRPQASTLPFSWPAIAPWEANSQQRLADALPLVSPDAPQITPYIFTVPPDDDTRVPASPTRIQSSNPVGDRIDIKRQGRVSSREPARRLSIHKPPLAALSPPNTIPSVADVPLRRLSLHKPPFVPLVPPNVPLIATRDASGSTPSRKVTANDTRSQETFASLPCTRRLSYHKPAFMPFAPANANSAAPKASGPIIPLAKIQNRDAVLKAKGVVKRTVAPPPLSSPASPISSIATPAPPYQEVNPFLHHAL